MSSWLFFYFSVLSRGAENRTRATRSQTVHTTTMLHPDLKTKKSVNKYVIMFRCYTIFMNVQQSMRVIIIVISLGDVDI